MEGEYHDLSLRLYEVLDWVGASEEMRGKYREKALVKEILGTIQYQYFEPSFSGLYVFGSSCEGTTTPGLNSDSDNLVCNNTPVIDHITDAPQHGLALLIVTDETTAPGYCKLQPVRDGVPLRLVDIGLSGEYVMDSYGRPCVKHRHPVGGDFREQNGPAVTRSNVEGNQDLDVVVAFKSVKIPHFAKQWTERVTNSNRLNKEQITIIKEYGCFFVGVNHPSSSNDPIEWRLSFSLQERELMFTLNPTQHKCYVFLKMIKKDIIHKHIPKSISSYHCKTCILYAVEHTQTEFWTRGNLLPCVYLCINILLGWVREQNCPNYFIPEENMFDRLDSRHLQRVQSVLEDIVEHWCRFLWSLSCDDIGNVLGDVLFGRGRTLMYVKQANITQRLLDFHMIIFRVLCTEMSDLFRCVAQRSASTSLLEVHRFHRHLQHITCIPEQIEKDTWLVLSYFMPHIYLSKAQFILSIMLTVRNTEMLWFRGLKYYLQKSKECGVISPYLVLASYCLQSNRLDICEKLLFECELSLKSHVLIRCSCNSSMWRNMYINQAFRELQTKAITHVMSYREFAQTSIQGCLTFLPCQANLVPPALRYEMFRSVNTPAGSRDEGDDFWFDWIAVDANVYLYFLQYVLFTNTNNQVCKQDAIDNLKHTVETEPNLGHRETGYKPVRVDIQTRKQNICCFRMLHDILENQASS